MASSSPLQRTTLRGPRKSIILIRNYMAPTPTSDGLILAAGGVAEFSSIPGNHSTYITERVQVVAKELRECFDRAVINNSFGR